MRKIAAVTLLALAVPASGAVAATLAVTAGRMIDVTTGARIDRPLVVITDGRITAVGRQGDPIPEGAERVDLPGLTLVPGLIDMHVHITSSPLYGGYNSLLFTDSFWPVIGVAHAKATLEAGFTTIRNVGSEGYGDVGLKQAIEADSSQGRGSCPPPTPSAPQEGIATPPSSRRR